MDMKTKGIPSCTGTPGQPLKVALQAVIAHVSLGPVYMEVGDSR